MSTHTPRRDRGVALPSPVAAISIVAIVAAAIAFAVTGFGGSKSKVIPNAAPTTSLHTSASASTTPSATGTATKSPSATATAAPVDKKSIHVSVWNASGISGLGATVLAKVVAAGWTDSATGVTRIHYSANAIYYPAKYEAAARQLALDLGITKLSTGDAATPQNKISVVLVTPLP